MRCQTVVLWSFVALPLSAQSLTWQSHMQAVAPQPREWSVMAYNAATQRCVMFGGLANNYAPIDDTWVWDGTAWTSQATAVRPPARSGAGMAYEAAGARVILFGGRASNGQPLNDTWSWDGTTWTQLSPANPPAPRHDMPLAYDPIRQVIVGFGGFIPFSGSVGGASARTFEFDGTDWSEVIPLQVPPQRRRTHLYFDEGRGRILMAGGVHGPVMLPRDDVWEWDGVTWTDVTPALPAPAVDGAAVAYDKSLQRMVRFGGHQLLQPFTDEQWFLDGFWRQGLGTVRPSARMGAAMAFDEARQQLVLFGERQGTESRTWTSSLIDIASSAPFGASCSGAAELSSDAPVLGTSVAVVMQLPPSIFAFLAAGWSHTSINGQPLPMDLSALGMPDCQLLTSSEVLGLPMFASGSLAAYSVTLPSDPTLIGTQMFWQGFALDPLAGPTPITTTNAIEWVFADV